MQNDNTQPPQQPVVPTPPISPVPPQAAPAPAVVLNQPMPVNTSVKPAQNMYETAMLIFGLLAIVSLMIGNGFFLKLTASIFLLVAVISIVKSAREPKPAQPAAPPTQQFGPTQFQPAKKPLTVWKVLGAIALAVILAPVIFYGGMILLFIIFMLIAGGTGGGNVGT